MASAARRRSPLLLVALLLSVVVLVTNAAVSGRDDGRGRRLDEVAYVDAARPLVVRSEAQGGDVSQVRASAASLGRDGVDRRLRQVVADVEAVHHAAERLEVPRSLTTAHGLLLATLAMRARAAGAVHGSLVAALASDDPGGVVDALTRAGEELVAADRTYAVFVEVLPRHEGLPSPPLPPSRWVTDAEAWTQPALSAFVRSLRASTVLSPVHDLAVMLVSPEPAPIGAENGVALLPLVRALRLQVVVSNVGNEPARRVPVVATLVTGEQADTARDFVDLEPGQRRTVVLGGLRPVPGQQAELRVLIGPLEAETNREDNEHRLALLVR